MKITLPCAASRIPTGEHVFKNSMALRGIIGVRKSFHALERRFVRYSAMFTGNPQYALISEPNEMPYSSTVRCNPT